MEKKKDLNLLQGVKKRKRKGMKRERAEREKKKGNVIKTKKWSVKSGAKNCPWEKVSLSPPHRREGEKERTGRPKAICGQRYPLPCFA